MKKTILLLILSLLSITNYAQKKEIELGEFSQLKTFDGLSVKLIKSSENKAVITGKYVDDVAIINKKGLLKIRLSVPRTFNGYDTYVSLYYRELNLIDANEGSYVFSEEKIECLDLDVKAQEGAEIEFLVDTKRLNARVVSGSKIIIKGNTNNQDITVNSGGEYHAKSLITSQTSVSVSAGGTATIYATEIAKATVKAGGNIRIYGHPKLADTKKVLGGTITIVD